MDPYNPVCSSVLLPFQAFSCVQTGPPTGRPPWTRWCQCCRPCWSRCCEPGRRLLCRWSPSWDENSGASKSDETPPKRSNLEESGTPSAVWLVTAWSVGRSALKISVVSLSLTWVIRVDDAEDGFQIGVVFVHGFQDTGVWNLQTGSNVWFFCNTIRRMIYRHTEFE